MAQCKYKRAIRVTRKTGYKLTVTDEFGYPTDYQKEQEFQVMVSCNKCHFCLQNRRNDWSFRIHQEDKVAITSQFITLTYETEHLPLKFYDDDQAYKALEKQDLFQFHKLLKQWQTRTIKKLAKNQKWDKARLQKQLKKWRVRYYSVGEYGTKFQRPHYHIIAFNIHPITLYNLHKIWRKGAISIGTVTHASIGYCTKYLIDKAKEEERDPPFTVMSRNPGLGSNYLTKEMRAWHREDNRHYVMFQGWKKRMPRYYKDKTFNALQKDQASALAALEAGKLFDAEIERLMQYTNDPHSLYYEQEEQKYERIRTKSLALNKL